MRDAKAKWIILANRTQNEWRAVGGMLSVNEQSLTFKPNLIDRNLKGESVEIQVNEIVDIEKCKKELTINNFFSGGLRDRLKIQLGNGKEELFVVADLDKVISDLTAIINK